MLEKRRISAFCNLPTLTKKVKYIGSKAHVWIGEMHVPTLAEHISKVRPQNGVVIDSFAGTFFLASAVIKMGFSAKSIEKEEFWFRTGIRRVALFSAPSLRCAVDRTAVRMATRLPHLGSEIHSALASEGPFLYMFIVYKWRQRSKWNSAKLGEESDKHQKQKYFESMAERGANTNLFEGQRMVGYKTIRPSLDESLQIQHVLHGADF